MIQPNSDTQNEILNTIKDQQEQLFQGFINMKMALQSITHRAVVQKIYRKYTLLTIKINSKENQKTNSDLKSYRLLGQQLSQQAIITSLYIGYIDRKNQQEKLKILQQLGQGFRNMINLKSLYFWESIFKGLGQDLAGLSNLENLELQLSSPNYDEQQDNIMQISKGLKRLTKLKIFTLRIVLGLSPQMLKEFWSRLDNLKKIQTLNLDLSFNKQLQESPENWKILGEYLKGRKGLKSLELNLSGNNLGESSENLKNLGNGFKELSELRSLDIGLNCCNLGNSEENMTNLADFLLGKAKLTTLKLYLSSNSLGGNRKNLKNLGRILSKLTRLQQFEIELANNYMGGDQEKEEENMKYLGDSLIGKNNLKTFSLNLGENSIYDIKNLATGLKSLTQLENLSLKLYSNDLENMIVLQDTLTPLKNLKILQLDLSQNYMGENDENIPNLILTLKALVQLEILEIDLEDNDLGQEVQNLIFIREFLKEKNDFTNISLMLYLHRENSDPESLEIWKNMEKEFKFNSKGFSRFQFK